MALDSGTGGQTVEEGLWYGGYSPLGLISSVLQLGVAYALFAFASFLAGDAVRHQADHPCVLLVLLLMPLYGIWLWFFCRLEVDSGKAAVLMAKTGTNLPSGQLMATVPEQKGIGRKVLPPGRHRLNPDGYVIHIRPAVRIRPGYVGSELSGLKILQQDTPAQIMTMRREH